MSTRVSRTFGSYNFFAKALPGTVFFLGFLSILPSSVFQLLFLDNPITVAFGALLVLFFGFIFGQGLHSFAVLFENITYGFIKEIYVVYVVLSSSFNSYLNNRLPIEINRREDRREISSKRIAIDLIIMIGALTYAIWQALRGNYGLIGGILLGWFLAIVSIADPKQRAVDWARGTLKPHRVLFSDFFRDGLSNNDPIIEKFSNKYSNRFGVRIAEEGPYDDVYELTLSFLSFYPKGRARVFQETFSFCRSMWVTLFIWSIVYLYISYNKYIFETFLFLPETLRIGYTPVIFGFSNSYSVIPYISGIMLLLVILFSQGERQYKSLFCRYIIADFIASEDSTHSEIEPPVG